ncbi:MAG: sterol desaturase family protein [Bdellovibrionota bacterium]
MTLVQLTRYTVVAGGAYLALSLAPRAWVIARRIQSVDLKTEDVLRELKYSLLTILIYGAIFAGVFNSVVRPHTQLYFDWRERGPLWLALSVLILILIHDTYFYWMHRFLHTTPLFRWTHRVHHLSTNPTPLASQAFHWLEALFEMLWIVPIFFLIPLTPNALITFSLFSLAYNVYGHLSVEIFQKRWGTTPLLNWLNTSTHHNGHHRFFNRNYGLYFLMWDRWMGTERL